MMTKPKSLQNDCWTEVLERGAKPITRTFGVVAHAVRVDSIYLAHKEITIEKIRAKNAASIPDLETKWIGWLTNLSQGKKKSLLVVECKQLCKQTELLTTVRQLERSYIDVHCTMQHVNRSNTSNVNKTAKLRLTVPILLLAVTALQVT